MDGDRTLGRRRYLTRAASAVATGWLAGCAEAPADTSSPDASADTPSGAAQPTDASGGSPATDASPTTDSATASPTTAVHPGYDTTEVTVETPDGAVLGRVTAAIADTPELRYTGLSDTESLPEDRGMLFVYDEVDDHTFVMREMDFGLDIVYADDEGVITTIHRAPAPGPDEDGEDQRYPGRGQYVLEVNVGWTDERGVTAGDVLAFEL